MKLENWGDLFKYSKELLDDDFNHGQQLVLKTKNKGADNTSVSYQDNIIYTSNNARCMKSSCYSKLT